MRKTYRKTANSGRAPRSVSSTSSEGGNSFYSGPHAKGGVQHSAASSSYAPGGDRLPTAAAAGPPSSSAALQSLHSSPPPPHQQHPHIAAAARSNLSGVGSAFSGAAAGVSQRSSSAVGGGGGTGGQLPRRAVNNSGSPLPAQQQHQTVAADAHVGRQHFSANAVASEGDGVNSGSGGGSSALFALLDTVAAVVGIISLVVALLATFGDVFERDVEFILTSDEATASSSSSSSSLEFPVEGGTAKQQHVSVRRQAHGLIDGAVGRAQLLDAIRSRVAARQWRLASLRAAASEAAVAAGRVLAPNTVSTSSNNDAPSETASLALPLLAQPLISEEEAAIAAKASAEALWMRQSIEGKYKHADKAGGGGEGGAASFAAGGPLAIVASSAVLWQQEPEARPLTSPLTSVQRERDVFDDDATFYVSIAQFKDVLCPNTIAEIYKNARNPRRVFAGIVDQRDANTEAMPRGLTDVGATTDNLVPKTNLDGTCFPWYMLPTCRLSAFCPTDNIRVRHAYPREGKGPTWGRYYAMLMYQGEKYFLGIDSHSRFVHHWDAQSVLNLLLVPKTTTKAVLSHYPGAFESYFSLMTPRRELWRMVMCAGHYTAVGIIRMDSVAYPMNGFPDMQAFSAGGYVFGNAQFVHEVPFDPYLFYVFDGEEVLFSVRLWTHGYDLFTPRTNILFHNYARHNAPRFWNIKGLNYGAQQNLGQARVKYFMKSMNNGTQTRMVSDEWARERNVNIEEDVYGLGKVRSLEDYYAFARANTQRWTVNKSFCDEIMTASHRYKYHKIKDLGGH